MNPFEQNAVDATTKLLRLTNLKITRQTVVKLLLRHPHFPSLASLKHVLEDLEIKTLAGSVTVDKLSTLPLPALVFLKVDGGIFAPIRKVTGNIVEWYHTREGWQKETLNSFGEQWTGAILLIDTATASKEKNYRFSRIGEIISRLAGPIVVATILITISLLFNIIDNSAINAFLISDCIGLWLSVVLLIKARSRQTDTPIRRTQALSDQRSDGKHPLKTSQSFVFELINWGELGSLYFGTRLLVIFEGQLFKLNIFSSLVALSAISLPVTFYLAYRLIKTEMWCTYYSMILFVTWLDATAGIYWFDYRVIPVPHSLYLVLSSGLFLVASYVLIKRFTSSSTTYNDMLREVKRIKYNSAYLDSVLKNTNQMPSAFENMKVLGIGNPSAKCVVTVICSPHKLESAELYFEMRKMQRVKRNIYCRVILLPVISRDIDVMKVMLNCPAERVPEAFDNWFSNIHQSVNKWKNAHSYGSALPDEVVQAQISLHEHWRKLAKIATVPSVFIDGALIPPVYHAYDLSNLLDYRKKMNTLGSLSKMRYKIKDLNTENVQQEPLLIQPYIFNWRGQLSKTIIKEKQLSELFGQVTVINSDDENRLSQWNNVGEEAYFAKQFTIALSQFDGDILFHVQGDASFENWSKITENATRYLELYNWGVYAPNVDYTYHNGERVNIKCIEFEEDTLSMVTIPDTTCWFVHRDIVAHFRERKIDLEECNKFGWGIDWVFCAISYQMGRPVIRDYEFCVDHPRSTGYNSNEAHEGFIKLIDSLDIDLKNTFNIMYHDKEKLSTCFKRNLIQL